MKIEKREFRWRCTSCSRSTEPGWLWLGGGDWVKCPDCEGGHIQGVQTSVTPTAKIIIPKRV